ncbi:MAG: HAD-IIIA family hydrolase [Nanoarchaeota archaeon]|nr:HAD-IIIA family hydrolase [Nanoarchaeota archaeon]
MTILVCLDRDGTINKDDNDFWGSTPDWKQRLIFLPGVIEGIKLLNQISGIEIFIMTNQAGVALVGPEFDELTEERYKETSEYMIELLKIQGAYIRGVFGCPYIDLKYLEKSKKRNKKVNIDYVIDNHPDWKPNIGMIKKAAESLGKTIIDCEIYFIGDRLTDVQTGLNAGGTGILVPESKTRELGDVKKVIELGKTYKNRIYIAKDFLDAAEYIKKIILSRRQ